MLLNPGNFLIFDEPTNHLDMQSKGILQQALQQFAGTLMIVSHDRDFLDPIVDKTLEIQPGHLKTWLGNISYYLNMKNERDEKAAKEKEARQEEAAGISRKEQRRFEAEKRNALSRKVKPLKKRLNAIEKEIDELENRQSEIEKIMADPGFYDDNDKVKNVSLEYETITGSIAENLNKWEEVAGRIEFIEDEYEKES